MLISSASAARQASKPPFNSRSTVVRTSSTVTTPSPLQSPGQGVCAAPTAKGIADNNRSAADESTRSRKQLMVASSWSDPKLAPLDLKIKRRRDAEPAEIHAGEDQR